MSENQLIQELAESLKQGFSASGLNMLALLPVSSLPAELAARLPRVAGTAPHCRALLLAGNAGPEFWVKCQRWRQQFTDPAAVTDPVDRFAHDTTVAVLDTVFKPAQYQVLYPVLPESGSENHPISLQQLGVLAGWHQPSPLGIGIHPQFGLWFAYRALVLLDSVPGVMEGLEYKQAVEQSTIKPQEQLCAVCRDRDCITACPAAALTLGKPPNMQRCSDFRLRNNSVCADRCLARNACPVAAGLRYNADQIAYHYTVSLESLRRWK